LAALVAYRAADWDTPLRAGPSRRNYRFSDASSDATQYWSLHPLGPLAEALRWRNIRDPAFAAALRLRLWAARFDDGGVVRVGFANARDHGIDPADLVSDDYRVCQRWAEAVRTWAPGVIVPSAALPGADNLVLFGPRVRIPYGVEPIDVQLEVPADPTAEDGHPPEDLLRFVRWTRTAHQGFDAWQLNVAPDPPQVRLDRTS